MDNWWFELSGTFFWVYA